MIHLLTPFRGRSKPGLAASPSPPDSPWYSQLPANRLAHRGRRGLALFDVILAVGVVGVLIAGGVLLLQGAQERIKRNDTLALINQVRAEAVRIFAGRPTYTGLTMDMLRVRGSLPDDVIRPNSRGDAVDGDNDNDYSHPYDAQVNVY